MSHSKYGFNTFVLILAALAAVLGLLATPAQAQPCGGQWLPGEGVPGVGGTVYATTMWDPDGAGPQPAALVAGGDFTVAGGVVANNIARWNGTAWSPLGTGMNNNVNALAVLPNGDLVAGGFFTTAGGVTANRIARWNGTAWSPLGTGMNVTVWALAVLPNGNLVAGGFFTTAGGVSASRIARWNGTAWSPLGTGMSGVNALAVLPNGDLVAGGFFTTAGGVTANRIARWNGTAWSPLGTGMNNSVNALAVLPNGDLVAGGGFTTAGGVTASGIARWNGTAWSPLGTGMNSNVFALAVLPSGDLVAGGFFTTAGGVSANRIARWNETAWSPLGTGMNGSVSALAVLPNGDLVAGGNFTTAGGNVSAYFARWTETNIPWVALQPQPQTLASGQTLNLSATPANGYANVSVQWQRNGVPITNGTGGASAGGGTVSGAIGLMPSPTNGTPATLTITNAQASDAGNFTAVFSNACGSATSTAATVTVNCPAPNVTSQPANAATCPSDTAAFSLTASGTTPAYQWQWQPAGPGTAWAALSNGINLSTQGTPAFNVSGATMPSMNITSIWGLGGNFRCIVTNGCGSVTSNVVTLTVLPASDPTCNPCNYDFNQDENIDHLDAQQMAQVFNGLLTPDANWLDGDLNGDENADLTDVQLLAAYVVTGVCGV